MQVMKKWVQLQNFKNMFPLKIQYFMSTYVSSTLFKWVELPSGWIVPGSWSIFNFGCCFVNFWGGHCLGKPVQSMVYLGRSTMPGWYKSLWNWQGLSSKSTCNFCCIWSLGCNFWLLNSCAMKVLFHRNWWRFLDKLEVCHHMMF